MRTLPKKENIPLGFKTSNDFFQYLFDKPDLIWMGQNTNHLSVPRQIVQAMETAIKKRQFAKYSPPEGLQELKQLILQDLGLEDDNEVLITAGGTEGLYITMRKLLEPHDHIITSDPGYITIEKFARWFGERVTKIPVYQEEMQYRMQPNIINRSIQENTKLLAVVDPINPLGSSYTEAEIKEFVDIAVDHDFIILDDITYRDFADEHTLTAQFAPERTITIHSFSKVAGMAGLRIGAVIAPTETLAELKKVMISDLGTDIIAQQGAVAALKTKQEWLPPLRKQLLKNQEIIKKAVDKVEGAFLPVYPSKANMFVIDLYETKTTPLKVAEVLLEKHNIFVRDGSYTSRRFGHRYLRVSFSVPETHVKKFATVFPEAVEDTS